MSAEIEIVYRVGYCDYGCSDYSIQCHTGAGDSGCEYYLVAGPTKTEDGHQIIPFGDCARAQFEYGFKGWTGKRYEMEECRDPYNPHLDSMLVTLGNKTYDCVKVILNGKCIFDEYEEG